MAIHVFARMGVLRVWMDVHVLEPNTSRQRAASGGANGWLMVAAPW